ncbi:MAG: hypothetical protein K1X74_00630 [Pirellulales bacterium]|nr:hypothetical protein [Pirellulales bacterium]
MWRIVLGGLAIGAGAVTPASGCACDVVVSSQVVTAAPLATLAVPAVGLTTVPVAVSAVASPVCVEGSACAAAAFPVATVVQASAAPVVVQSACAARRLGLFGGRARSRSVVRVRSVVR